MRAADAVRRRLAWVAAGIALAALGATGAAGEAADMGHEHGASAFEREMDTGMVRMMEAMHGGGYSGDADFLTMMIPHHADAIEMARLVLRYGHDPATRQLAEDIIASQAVEIQSMENRLALLRRSRAASDSGFPALGGTRGP
jgi:uncharacterized protein (DUF305 family)